MPRRRGRGRSWRRRRTCPSSDVAVGTTHNHSVPVTFELGGAWIRRNRELVDPYVETVFDGIGRAAAAAAGELRPVRVGSAAGSSPLAVNRQDDDAGRAGRGRPERERGRRPHADGCPARRRGRQPRRHDRPLRVPPDHPRTGQHVGDARVPGDREAGRRGGARRALPLRAGRVRRRRAVASCSCRTCRCTGDSARMLGHEAAATAFRASWRALSASGCGRARPLRGSRRSSTSPTHEPDGTVRSPPRRSRCRCADDLGDPARGGSRRSDARTRPTPHGPRARRRPRCASSPCGRSSPGCAPSAARARRASRPTRCSSTGSGSGRSRCSAFPSSSSARSGWRSVTRRASGTTLVVGLLERLSQLPADGRGAAARRLRDRHLALPARRGRARDGLGGQGARGAAMSRRGS